MITQSMNAFKRTARDRNNGINAVCRSSRASFHETNRISSTRRTYFDSLNSIEMNSRRLNPTGGSARWTARKSERCSSSSFQALVCRRKCVISRRGNEREDCNERSRCSTRRAGRFEAARASSYYGNDNKKAYDIPEPYKSAITIIAVTMVASLIASSDLSIAFPYLAPVQRGAEVISTNALKTLGLVFDGALDTVEFVLIILSKIKFGQAVAGGVGFASALVKACLAAASSAFVFVTSRIAMFFATIAVAAGAGASAFATSTTASGSVPTTVVVVVTALATVLMQNMLKIVRASSSTKTAAAVVANVPPPPVFVETPSAPAPPVPVVVVPKPVAQPVISEIIVEVLPLQAAPTATTPPPPQVIDKEAEEVRVVFERLKAEAEAQANISSLKSVNKASLSITNNDSRKIVGSKQKFQAFTYLLKETLDSIKGITEKDADEVIFDAKFQAKEVANITKDKLNEAFADKALFEETLKRTLKKTVKIANEAAVYAEPVFKELSPVIQKQAKKAARAFRNVDISAPPSIAGNKSSTTSSAPIKNGSGALFELPDMPKMDMPKVNMPKIEMPKIPDVPKMKMPTTTTSQTPTAQQQQQQQEQQQPATKAEVVPKQAVKEKNDIVPTIVQEKDTKSIEDAKKQAAAKVLKEMAALEDKLAKDVEAAQEKVKRATELEAAQQQQKTSSVASSTTSAAAAAAAAAAASTPTKTSTKNASSVAIFETSDGLRFSKDDDVNTSSPSPSSSSSTATTTAALVVPNIELPRNTRVITDSEDELSEDSRTIIKRRKK